MLYDGDNCIPGALDAVRRVQESQLQVRFITNTSQHTRETLLGRLRGFGFELEDSQLFTAVDAARQWLIERDLRPFPAKDRHIIGDFDHARAELPDIEVSVTTRFENEEHDGQQTDQNDGQRRGLLIREADRERDPG